MEWNGIWNGIKYKIQCNGTDRIGVERDGVWNGIEWTGMQRNIQWNGIRNGMEYEMERNM